jgi:hypothetical protein
VSTLTEVRFVEAQQTLRELDHAGKFVPEQTTGIQLLIGWECRQKETNASTLGNTLKRLKALRPLRISAFSAFKTLFNADAAEIRRGPQSSLLETSYRTRIFTFFVATFP